MIITAPKAGVVVSSDIRARTPQPMPEQKLGVKVIAIVMTIAMYWLFHEILHVPLPHGLLFDKHL